MVYNIAITMASRSAEEVALVNLLRRLRFGLPCQPVKNSDQWMILVIGQ